MKPLWQTAHAAWRLSLQTGSDDGYYPGPTYRFAHGSKRQRAAINRAIEILQAPDDKMKNRAPGRILQRMRNHQRGMGPPTLLHFNCRCAMTQLIDSTVDLLTFGGPTLGPRTMHGLVDPAAQDAYEGKRAEARAAHDKLLTDLAESGAKSFVWMPAQDGTNKPWYKPEQEKCDDPSKD